MRLPENFFCGLITSPAVGAKLPSLIGPQHRDHAKTKSGEQAEAGNFSTKREEAIFA